MTPTTLAAPRHGRELGQADAPFCRGIVFRLEEMK